MSKNKSNFYLPLSKRKGKLKYSLMNDYLFKLIMQENTEILRAFLCALLRLKPEEITSIEIKNSIILGKTVKDKQIFLDINLELNHNQCINIELQVANVGNWQDRSVVYLCRNFDKLSRGEDYIKVTPTHHIGILNFTLPNQEPEFYSHYYLINIKTGKVYNDKFCLSVLELNQIHLATQEDIDSGLQYWARFFKATTWEELKMLAKQDPIFETASDTVYKLSYESSYQDAIRRREEEIALIRHIEEENQKKEAEIEDLKAEIEALKAENMALKAVK